MPVHRSCRHPPWWHNLAISCDKLLFYLTTKWMKLGRKLLEQRTA